MLGDDHHRSLIVSRPFVSLPSIAAIVLLAGLASSVFAAPACVVIAHRGASGYLPEHTLEAFRLAIAQGADMIEPDVILTRDGVPVVRHESLLQLTTDVAERPEFADRRRTQQLAGREFDGWFSEDFTLAELRTLRATERYPDLRPDSAARNGEFMIPTLQEVIDLARDAGRVVGLYPELKQVAYFSERGLDMVAIVLGLLADNGFTNADDAVLVQSFESAALRRADGLTDLRLVQLLGAEDPAIIATEISGKFLRATATYADGIGVPKYDYVMHRPAGDELPVPTSLLTEAHVLGLFVHAYTFRPENRYLPRAFRRGDADALHGHLPGELALFIAAGLDGFFTDSPDVGRRACDAFSKQ